MEKPLRILAGPEAMSRIRAEGLHPDLFDVVAGASGGPKWLMLSRLDQAIFGNWFRERSRPLALVGSSIGTWRFVNIARRDSLAACRRFEEQYLQDEFPGRPDPAALSRHCRRMLEVMLGATGVDEVLSHPIMRLSILAVRRRGVDGSAGLGVWLAASGLANMLTRRSLPLFFERTVIHDRRSPPPFHLDHGFATQPVGLSRHNLIPALLASAAVPFVFDGIRDLEGARSGLYLDGGIMDYHLDIPFTPPGLVLFPHFSSRIVPGWFDKFLPWRRARQSNLSRTLMVCPGDAFIASLPGGRIPDRSEFARLPTAERQQRWTRVVAETQRLADLWQEAVTRDQMPDLLEPLAG